MRLLRFYRRFKNLYRTHHHYASLWDILKWALVQSRKRNSDPDRLDKFRKAGITVITTPEDINEFIKNADKLIKSEDIKDL